MKNQLALSTALLVLCACTNMHNKEDRSFVTKLGNDTVAVESYTIDANSVQGTSVQRSPKTTIQRYSMTTGKDGLPESFSIGIGPYQGESQITRNYRYYNDSVEIVTTQSGASKSNTVKITGRPFPFFVNVFGIWDFALRHALQSTGPRQLATLAGGRSIQYEIQGTVPGRLVLDNPSHDFGPVYASVDSSGALQSFDLTPTTDKFVANRSGQQDIHAIAKRYAAREQAGTGLGVLSPRDTVRASIGGSEITIDYGRPTMRGRAIYGNVVPWDVVWRLGANAATQLTATKTLRFGSTNVEPGTYSLFALPSENGWKLIINKQHGQWGTVYDQAKDLARLALKTESLTEPVEQFTIGIRGQGKNGTLSFEWEKTRESIPFTVR